jgi:cephalosporin-C deacetylase-like acetyl esterase
MVQFQKFLRNLPLILHGYNVSYQQRDYPSFSCAYSSSLLMLMRGRGTSFQDGIATGELQYSMSVVFGLKKTQHTRIKSILNRARNSLYTIFTDLDT